MPIILVLIVHTCEPEKLKRAILNTCVSVILSCEIIECFIYFYVTNKSKDTHVSHIKGKGNDGLFQTSSENWNENESRYSVYSGSEVMR